MIRAGDLFDVLPTLEAESLDACVTDPPYGIGFMGRKWDTFSPDKSAALRERKVIKHENESPERQLLRQTHPGLKGRTVDGYVSASAVEYNRSLEGQRGFQAWTERWAREVLRVLKPGAHLVVCGAPRSFHRMTCGLEDAGFAIRDCLSWLYGQGFPKSLNCGNGQGTALKPGWEPIILARKPFTSSVADVLNRFGTGTLNIDACRIGDDDTRRLKNSGRADFPHEDDAWTPRSVEVGSEHGRWPANVCLDAAAAQMLDKQASDVGGGNKDNCGQTHGFMEGRTSVRDDIWDHADARGGASRFYYVAKPSREERDYGCAGLVGRSSLDTVSRDPSSAGANNPRAGAGRTSVLNTAEIVYNVAWVDAVLARRLQPDTDQSRRKATIGYTTPCSDGSVWSMCWCGSPSTDPFHPVVKSIIETETSSTTDSIISNSSRRLHANGCMAAAFGVMAVGGNLAAYAEFQSPWKRLIGTSQKKAGPSTGDVNLATSIASWLISAPENGGGHRVEASRNFHPT